MSMITEQVKRLRSEAAGMILQNGTTARLLREAADTIEALSAKVRIENGFIFPENATNGDVLKSLLYGKAIITEFIHDVNISVNNTVVGQFDMEWWNAPYKEGYTECCGNCFFFNGDTTDTQPQFCDEKEEYVNSVYRCIRYRQRGETE